MPGRKHSTARTGGKATKNPRKYRALRRKGMSKARAAKISNAAEGNWNGASFRHRVSTFHASHHAGRWRSM